MEKNTEREYPDIGCPFDEPIEYTEPDKKGKMIPEEQSEDSVESPGENTED
jgi:hypothetical protein